MGENMKITFDMTALSNGNLSPSNVYITFAANASDMVYGSGLTEETINFSGGNVTIDGTSYEPAQPANPYYSAYGNVVSANSGGLNGITFSRGGIYGSPYDDRFGLNLISPNADTDEMRITLLADGDLKPTAR